nr:hypothetical protein Iba_chr10bCG3930 [Ipomoea batatas]
MYRGNRSRNGSMSRRAVAVKRLPYEILAVNRMPRAALFFFPPPVSYFTFLPSDLENTLRDPSITLFFSLSSQALIPKRLFSVLEELIVRSLRPNSVEASGQIMSLWASSLRQSRMSPKVILLDH